MAHLGGGQSGALTKPMFYGVMKNSGLVLHSCFSLKLLVVVTEATLLLFCIKSKFPSFKLGDNLGQTEQKPTLLRLV